MDALYYLGAKLYDYIGVGDTRYCFLPHLKNNVTLTLRYYLLPLSNANDGLVRLGAVPTDSRARSFRPFHLPRKQVHTHEINVATGSVKMATKYSSN